MRTAQLGDHATFLSGFAFKSKLFNNSGKGLPVVRIRDVVRGHSETFYSGEYHDRYLVSRDDCLIGMDGEFNLARWKSETALLNQRVCKITSISRDINREYLVKFLPIALKKIEDATPFVTVKHLSVKALNKIQIPLPPIAEQKRIAGILDAADTLRVKRRDAIASLDTLLQSTFLTLFGDPVTNPMGWECIPFNEIGEFVSGATPSKAREDFWNGTIPWVSPKDMKVSQILDSQNHVTELAFAETNLKLLSPKHFLIVIRGMILAHSFPIAINYVPVSINQDMKGILPRKEFNILFLLECVHQLKRQILSEVSTAAHGTKRLDAEAMKNIFVPLPPPDLQNGFAKIVSSIEKQKAQQRAHLAELDTLFSSLQSRAFKGEL